MKFDKYELYRKAVQDPPGMADMLSNVYHECSGRWPKTLREDFCGTFALSHEWVTRDAKHSAIAVDNAAEPLIVGEAAFEDEEDARERLSVRRQDVLKASGREKSDIVCALNFSYGVFKTRPQLRRYLELCHARLEKKGIVALDVLGGIEIAGEMETEAEFPGFRYVWQQVRFDPVTREALFHIHFDVGGKLHKKAFVYDWRMWTVGELRDLLDEVGFKKTYVYWEGFGRLKEGDGPSPGESWVAYVVGVK